MFEGSLTLPPPNKYLSCVAGTRLKRNFSVRLPPKGLKIGGSKDLGQSSRCYVQYQRIVGHFFHRPMTRRECGPMGNVAGISGVPSAWLNWQVLGKAGQPVSAGSAWGFG